MESPLPEQVGMPTMRHDTLRQAAARTDEELGNGVLEIEEDSVSSNRRRGVGCAVRLCDQAVLAGYAVALAFQYVSLQDAGPLSWWLAIVTASLAFDSFVVAAGDVQAASHSSLLELMSRLRFLVLAISWAWAIPWSAELACRCGADPPPHGVAPTLFTVQIAIFMNGFFLVRELSYVLCGEPVSALDATAPRKFGDCLPSNALLGGQFRLNKQEFEETGRIVYVPARPRAGLFIPPGLALLMHQISAWQLTTREGGGGFITEVPWWLLGTLCALLCRNLGQGLWAQMRLALCKAVAEGEDGGRPRQRGGGCDVSEASRIAARVGELVWVLCCVQQQRWCESQPAWLPRAQCRDM